MLQEVKTTSIIPLDVQEYSVANKGKSFFKEFTRLNKDDKMFQLITLGSLGILAYGLTNGVVTGDFTQAKYAAGLFGMCSLIKGNMAEDEEVSKTCIKLGSIASIIFFLTHGDSSHIIINEENTNPLRCTSYPPSILENLKQAWNIS
jgi:hypothetical protein